MKHILWLCVVLCSWVDASEERLGDDSKTCFSCVERVKKDIEEGLKPPPKSLEHVLKKFVDDEYMLGYFVMCTEALSRTGRTAFIGHQLGILQRSQPPQIPYPTIVSTSEEMVPFYQLPIQLPKFFCDFYEAVREKAFNNGALWQQALLNHDEDALKKLKLESITEVDWSLNPVFRRLFSQHCPRIFDQLTKHINDSLLPDFPIDRRGIIHLTNLWGDMILPSEQMDSDQNKNTHFALRRLRGLIIMIVAAMSVTNNERDVEDHFFRYYESIHREGLNRLIGIGVFLVERRLAKLPR